MTKRKKIYLFMDQHGSYEYAISIKELQHKCGGRVSKMYVDSKTLGTLHTGHVIGKRWFTRYAPVEVKA
ncbi:MAG: hypothetical protein ACRDFB_04490 [Rhabdochlamydiaceae bacterium]